MAMQHVVVDGSNIATEGRTMPSLHQLDEAVTAFLEEHPGVGVTVVVDATFGHRIADNEKAEYEEAILNGELVTPPAGAIGRGDAFVLQIADRAETDVFSNDSFQEFHGQYPWLFDEGRLIGGKPVPNVGWIFVLRAPVRGPTSRRSVREAKRVKPAPAKSSPAKSATKPAKAAPKVGRNRSRRPPRRPGHRPVPNRSTSRSSTPISSSNTPWEQRSTAWSSGSLRTARTCCSERR